MPKRGEIRTADGFPLVTNKVSYLLYINPAEVKNRNQTIELLSPLLDMTKASISAELLPDRLWFK